MEFEDRIVDSIKNPGTGCNYVEVSVGVDHIETIMVALDSYKRKRLDEALQYYRDGFTDLADKAWREAAELDVYWHGLSKLLPKNS